MYLYMGKTFKIGLESLGATWALVALNAPILSKNKAMNIGGGVCFWKSSRLKEIPWNFSKRMEDIG